jgi:hypothetical protein
LEEYSCKDGEGIGIMEYKLIADDLAYIIDRDIYVPEEEQYEDRFQDQGIDAEVEDSVRDLLLDNTFTAAEDLCMGNFWRLRETYNK